MSEESHSFKKKKKTRKVDRWRAGNEMETSRSMKSRGGREGESEGGSMETTQKRGRKRKRERERWE